MTLTPDLSIGALTTYTSSYDPALAAAGLPYMNAYVEYFGVRASHTWYGSLDQQVTQKCASLGGDPVPLSDQQPDILRHCGICAAISMNNMPASRQLLLLAEFEGANEAHVQFFIGTRLLATEHVDGSDRVAFLFSCKEGNTYLPLAIRLASEEEQAGLKFFGLDLYIL